MYATREDYFCQTMRLLVLPEKYGLYQKELDSQTTREEDVVT